MLDHSSQKKKNKVSFGAINFFILWPHHETLLCPSMISCCWLGGPRAQLQALLREPPNAALQVRGPAPLPVPLPIHSAIVNRLLSQRDLWKQHKCLLLLVNIQIFTKTLWMKWTCEKKIHSLNSPTILLCLISYLNARVTSFLTLLPL